MAVALSPPAGAGVSTTIVYYDEEECLTFAVFVAELELVVGSSKDKRSPDGGRLLELLQKLAASISRADRATLKAHQARCESALVEALTKGTCSQVWSE